MEMLREWPNAPSATCQTVRCEFHPDYGADDYYFTNVNEISRPSWAASCVLYKEDFVKVIRPGKLNRKVPKRWEVRTACNVCNAELSIRESDLKLRKWLATLNMNSRQRARCYFAYVICPECERTVPIPKSLLDPIQLNRWAIEFSSSAYDIATKNELETGTW